MKLILPLFYLSKIQIYSKLFKLHYFLHQNPKYHLSVSSIRLPSQSISISWTISRRFSHLIFFNNSLNNTDCQNYQIFFILYFPLHYILFITQSIFYYLFYFDQIILILLISMHHYYAQESCPHCVHYKNYSQESCPLLYYYFHYEQHYFPPQYYQHIIMIVISIQLFILHFLQILI